MKYRKRPVVIEAFQLGIHYVPDWFMDKVSSNDIILYNISENDGYAEIKTLEGIMKANHGDYVILGVQGEVYPCKPDIFNSTYEWVE
jgi:hypothetical protein